MQNHYPWWKNLLLVVMLVLGLVYALPNVFGDDPSVQVAPKGTAMITQTVIDQTKQALDTHQLVYQSVRQEGTNLLMRFHDVDTQLKARDVIRDALSEDYVVAINLAPRNPRWLEAIGAVPMKLGLDLRGGVHFLLSVDVNAVINKREEADMRSMGQNLRSAKIRYSGIRRIQPNGVLIQFRDQKGLDDAYSALTRAFSKYQMAKQTTGDTYALQAMFTDSALNELINYAVDQNMSILNKRVNELGVSEALVMRQGRSNISVDLPGIQDTARAKDLIGKVATIRLQMVDTENDPYVAMKAGAPLGTRLYMMGARPYLLKNEVVLWGSSITYATAAIGQDGRPTVNVRLGGGGEANFNRVTAQNIGKPMATVYVETKDVKRMVDGKTEIIQQPVEKLINVATIESALGTNFEITGLPSQREAQNLALLLRSGAFSAPVKFISEVSVGPSLGKANIDRGVISVVVGFLIVVFFMLFYYRFFGLFADMALIFNLIFIVAIQSVIGATLTLPSIAAIVLTVGMAVDANVLINERIREELRNGMSPQAAIHAGYELAFSTIVDANVTTLIVALVLFALGTPSVQGFAITLIIGLMTSMVTAIAYTRSVVNWIYGRRTTKRLSIGIRV